MPGALPVTQPTVSVPVKSTVEITSAIHKGSSMEDYQSPA